MGLLARSTVPSLMRLLKDPESTVRTQAALALWSIDAKADVALPILNLVLKDVDNNDRWEAIEAVGMVSVEARPAIRGLTEVVVAALKDRDARVRCHAARWLFRREQQARVVIPLLREAVTDRDVFVRLSAVEALGEMGAEARILGLLTAALEDRDLTVRLAAEEALAHGGADVVPSLIEALKSSSAKVRLGVVRALGMIGPAAKAALPALQSLKADKKDVALRKAVEESLLAINPNPAG
jgi:HEAT repeat protein